MRTSAAATLIVCLAAALVSLPACLLAAVTTTPPPTTEECLGCHSDPSATKDVGGKSVSVHVDPKLFQGSIHGNLQCSDCHSDIKGYPHDPAPQHVACGSCHPDAQSAYGAGIHGRNGNGRMHVAKCLDCHGAPHEILPSSDPKSRTYRTHIPETCGSCHGQKFVMEAAGLTAQPFLSYRESVHGRAVAASSLKAAVCTDCHKSHEILAANDPRSSIFKFNVPATCGTCHTGIGNQYKDSVHGKALARGNWQAPGCTDCHGIHSIKGHLDPKSAVASQAVARTTCPQCHEGVRLAQEYGIAGNRVSSYQASYHGMAKKLGSDVAANCASCHGVHDILPSSDPRSTVNKANLTRTCGQCHKGATTNFTRGRIHLTAGEGADAPTKALSWIRRIYLGLIWSTIGFMAFHNLLIWWRKAQARRRSADRTVLRMNRHQRAQHFLLLSSFIVLVLTGFALKYPDILLATMFGSSEWLRRIIHRIAAVVMIGLGIYHIGYMVGTAEGRKGLRDFWFEWKDMRDLLQTFRYYLGFSKERPQFKRFSYGEKAEYWAVVWGTFVMGLTGLMIWYNVAVAHWMARWWVDIATAIHWYEAILATLAIVVWHFYHVIFDPEIYPMSWTWFDGKMSEKQHEEEHGLEE